MTDHLRDRIAAVLVKDAFGMTTKTAAYRQADAVIREVLTPEWLADMVVAAVQKAADDE